MNFRFSIEGEAFLKKIRECLSEESKLLGRTKAEIDSDAGRESLSKEFKRKLGVLDEDKNLGDKVTGNLWKEFYSFSE